MGQGLGSRLSTSQLLRLAGRSVIRKIQASPMICNVILLGLVDCGENSVGQSTVNANKYFFVIIRTI